MPGPQSFVPDTFVPDEEDKKGPSTFVPETFQADEPEPKGLLETLWHAAADPLTDAPSRFAKGVANWLDNPMDRGSEATPIRSFIAGATEGAGDLVSGLTSPINLAATALTGGSSAAAKAGLPNAAKLLGYGAKAALAPVLAHGAINTLHPESSLSDRAWGVAEMAGAGAGMLHTPTVADRGPRLIPDEPLEIPAITRADRLLEAPKDPYIASDTGQVQRRSLITPQEEARLAGYDYEYDPTGRMVPKGEESLSPADHGVDFGEIRERERLAGLDYTGHEQAGGSFLELPDQPLMDIPVEAGDTRLGFGNVSNADLPYPLNIAPESVRPRSVQTVTRALAGDDFAREVEGSTPVEFGNEIPPEATQQPQTMDLRGGTASITPDEPILPSAPRTPPHVTEQEIPKTGGYEDRVSNFTRKNIDPAIPGASAEVAPIINARKSTFRDFAEGMLISGERQLEKMGPVGQELRRVLSGVEYQKRELFNEFADPFIEATKKLSTQEASNFVDVMDGKADPISPNVAIAVEKSRAITTKMADYAEAAGVRVKTGKGVMPFKGLDKYWPHRPVNPVGRSNFIDELMKRNPSLSRSQAERLSRKFQNESEFFNSPQHSRMFGDFEYRKDLNSMVDHMADMADIISRAEILGAGDIGQKGTLVSRLIEQAPDPARAAELVRTHLRGGMDKNSRFYQAVKQLIE
jgi:hypothetical protein